MRSEATTVDEYLAELPDDRRDAIETARGAIVANLAPGFHEVMNWGMIVYEVPLETYPDTYNGQPLMYAALASQKNHMAVYLTAVYSNENTRDAFLEKYRETGKRLDMGKSCVRFRRIDDLPVDLIGETIGSMDVDAFLENYERSRGKK
jgi:uncharacterized protein YdhG (YjbR/CyaY superfamily)